MTFSEEVSSGRICEIGFTGKKTTLAGELLAKWRILEDEGTYLTMRKII